ncbi:MAG: autotransporter-associated beta strand repeat-containing protein [Planctomycetota bacterium]
MRFHCRHFFAALLTIMSTLAWVSLCAQEPIDPDLNGVLLKPIPDKLIVLTFDDAPASHATVVAPILKEMGFGGTFYVCNFDSFKTRKDWYLTWRQMIQMESDKFEIGNHTVGHSSSLSAIQAMEDELASNGGPKMTTVCWPIYNVNWGICPTLSASGYTFGRGGHERTYRPTVDNPFDVPSFTVRDGPPMENFIKQVQQACRGRVTVFCFHGVPDREHPPVSLEPATFKMMMQYLKDNNYTCIAMRDMAQYIDTAKAAKLPQTVQTFKDVGPAPTVKDDKPFTAQPIPKKVSTPERMEALRPATNMLTFTLPGAISSAISGTRIFMTVPSDMDVTTLAPNFTLSPATTAAPASGTALNFSTPQTYIVSASDGSTKSYSVTVAKSAKDASFMWSKAEPGNWSDGVKWSSKAPATNGRADYSVTVNPRGPSAITNDLAKDFLLNQLNLGDGCRGSKLSGNGLVFATNPVSGFPPAINASKCGIVDINVPVSLQDDLHINTSNDKDPNCFITFNDVISGPHALMLYSSGDPNVARINFHDVHFGILQINNTNTYSGGTFISGGKINVRKSGGLGTGPITLDNFGTLATDATLANPVTINNGTLFHTSLSGPVTLNADAHFIGTGTLSGDISGSGGFIMHGTNGTYLNMVPGGVVTLAGRNSYSGPTIVFPGMLVVKKASGLYNGDASKWTPATISIHKAATLRLNAGGPDEFTGANISTLLTNLTTGINSNGLMEGSFFYLDTTNTTEMVTVTADIADSKGPRGGAFRIKKCGTGALQLSGNNTYTGQTILESGTLFVSSLNSFTKGMGRVSSSLGAPMDIESAEIVLGEEKKDGQCTLVYTGTGETSDRVMNLAGNTFTATFDHSGTGLFKLTNPLLISGYGHSKKIELKGDTVGTGEIAGSIIDPVDRAGKALTSVIKSGTGTWILSGTNTFTGPTVVQQGTLVLATERSLGSKTSVRINSGATVELNFKGQLNIRSLSFDEKAQPPGTYSAANAPGIIKGSGTLLVQP